MDHQSLSKFNKKALAINKELKELIDSEHKE